MAGYEYRVFMSTRAGDDALTEAIKMPEVRGFVSAMGRIILSDLTAPNLLSPLHLTSSMQEDEEGKKEYYLAASGLYTDTEGVGKLSRAYSIALCHIRLADRKRIQVVDVRDVDVAHYPPRVITDPRIVKGARMLIGAINKDVLPKALGSS